MRRTLVAIITVILTTSAVARADDATSPRLDLHVGLGLPVGGVGIGVRMGRVEVLAEGELLGAGMVMVMSAGAHVNVDVVQRPRWGLYAGGFGGAMQMVSELPAAYHGFGAVGGVRIHHRSGSMSHAIEAGTFYARCAEWSCGYVESFLSLQVAYRLQFHVL